MASVLRDWIFGLGEDRRSYLIKKEICVGKPEKVKYVAYVQKRPCAVRPFLSDDC